MNIICIEVVLSVFTLKRKIFGTSQTYWFQWSLRPVVHPNCIHNFLLLNLVLFIRYLLFLKTSYFIKRGKEKYLRMYYVCVFCVILLCIDRDFVIPFTGIVDQSLLPFSVNKYIICNMRIIYHISDYINEILINTDTQIHLVI